MQTHMVFIWICWPRRRSIPSRSVPFGSVPFRFNSIRLSSGRIIQCRCLRASERAQCRSASRQVRRPHFRPFQVRSGWVQFGSYFPIPKTTSQPGRDRWLSPFGAPEVDGFVRFHEAAVFAKPPAVGRKGCERLARGERHGCRDHSGRLSAPSSRRPAC